MLQNENIPDTGISGVYEVMVGTDNPEYLIKYFKAFGFRMVQEEHFSAAAANEVYGVDSKLHSIRMQNGDIDSHGLLRILAWEQPIGPGVGYAPPETIGTRMAVMMTKDIFRLVDIFEAARNGGEPWLVTQPVSDDLFGLDNQKRDFFQRPVMVRETGIYGAFFNHVFFQRYGYRIPGYGTIGDHSSLKTSEFTHHDFAIKGDIRKMGYLSSVLGLRAEAEPELNGDWQAGPQSVFQFRPGESHWYWGFVSPNNICGKLKFFVPQAHQLDRSAYQQVGALGISLHSFYTPRLDYVYDLAKKEEQLRVNEIKANEFGERSFLIQDEQGCSWQIISKDKTKHQAIKELQIEKIDE